TNWAITQRGLKPATRVVLWHLCDRHNPDLGCFPSQDKLAYDCEMSRSALNEHLKILELTGLIRREQHINPRTKQQENTRYRFAFEADFVTAQDVVEPSPESGHGAESGKEGEPCPENAYS
ncbi:MAG: helix-turn-helix domain-containing protein, partial [Mesorhizobium sp.]